MLRIQKIEKRFKNFSLNQLSLEVEEGEYFVLAGPSGSGKSLLFNIIAGIEKADRGNIFFKGKDITKWPIQKREIGLLFQKQSLFPHLTVRQNIEYALRLRKINTLSRINRFNVLTEDMGIEPILERRPANLSGGEIQRVSMARALASGARTLLLDEPLTSLDVQLRADVSALLKSLHKEGYTIMHITHDHREAFAFADRMAIMTEGQILQHGSPMSIYRRPSTKFIADFMGVRNFFTCLQIDDHHIRINEKMHLPISRITSGDNPFQLIIPENALQIVHGMIYPLPPFHLEAIISDTALYPDYFDIFLDAGISLYLRLPHEDSNYNQFQKGMEVMVKIDPEKLLFF